MTIRAKTLLIVGATLIGLIVLLYYTTENILMRGYIELEERSTRTNIARVTNGLTVQRENLTTIALGYSNWDDSYNFVSDRDPQYVENNMGDTTFTYNQVNVILFLDNDLNVVFQRAFDLANGVEIDLPAGLTEHLAQGDRLTTHADEASIVDGIVMLPNGPMLVTSLPVVRNDGSGPVSGIMIWGRFLDDTQVQRLSEATNVNVTLTRADAADMPADVRAAKALLDGGQSPVLRPLNDSAMGGYVLIYDIYGEPVLIQRIAIPREIFAQGRASVSYFFAAVLFGSVVFIAVTMLLIERTVLARLSKLSAAVTHVRETDDLNTQIPVQGSDELTNLATALRELLATQQEARAILQDTNAELERRVNQRTQELTQSNELLAQARDQALEALQVKTQILANVSHDARTPLTTIMLRTELFQLGRYGEVTDEQRKVFDIIYLNARQLLDFINNLLTEAQISSAKVKVAHEPYSPAALMDSVYQTLLPLAERKDLVLSVATQPDLPGTALGDAHWLRQIVTNLAQNAIKFTDQGSVTMSLRRHEQGKMMLEVSDTGKGIPEEARQFIFEPFWQVDGSKTREANRGVGLGLSIVRQLTSLLGGEIDVASKPGSGTKFTVILPLYEPQGEHVNATVRHRY